MVGETISALKSKTKVIVPYGRVSSAGQAKEGTYGLASQFQSMVDCALRKYGKQVVFEEACLFVCLCVCLLACVFVSLCVCLLPRCKGEGFCWRSWLRRRARRRRVR